MSISMADDLHSPFLLSLSKDTRMKSTSRCWLTEHCKLVLELEKRVSKTALSTLMSNWQIKFPNSCRYVPLICDC